MKKVLLSLEESKDNQQLLSLIKKQSDIQLVDLAEIKDDKFTVIVNGPLTQLADILMTRYKLISQIEEVLFVGGTDAYGDVTPVAEKNVYADVFSAQQVFLSTVKIVMFGLNVTEDLQNRALAPLVYLKEPSVFVKEQCGIYVETKGKVTYGKTVTDVYSDFQFEDHHCEIILDIDIEKYNSIIKTL
ncbi:MAG TPA: nucleoside hydrolase [Erysipelotrichaceae bacterium]|nr:nucleoside hydrolase [Erysipelotrichaceae bacterium]HQB32949.1 nucleoside hydrolase [Erysipelotrichaceae bacterium]